MEKAINFFKRHSMSKRSNSFCSSLVTRKKAATVQDDSFNQVKKRILIDNFAEDLLNLELDMEQPTVDVKNVHRLLELYANGVEYYESIKSNRYLIFQNKMKNLLLKPNVIDALNGFNAQKEQQEQTKGGDESPKELKNSKPKSHEEKELDLHLFLAKQKSNDEDIKYLMEEKKTHLDEVNNIIEKEISTQKNTILDKLESRKKNKLAKCTSQPLFASPQLPRRPSKKKQSNEIKESEEEYSQTALMDMESKKRKRKSILMLRKVSNELNNMIETLNFGSTRKMSMKKKGSAHIVDKENSLKENKINMEDSLGNFLKIEEVLNENPEKINEEEELKKKEEEEKLKVMEAKIQEVERKFHDEIEKLEKKMGQNKSSVLISKMIDKAKQDKEKSINAIKAEYSSDNHHI